MNVATAFPGAGTEVRAGRFSTEQARKQAVFLEWMVEPAGAGPS